MDRIYLTRQEKRALLTLAGRLPQSETNVADYEYGLFCLSEKGFVRIAVTEGGHIEDARLLPCAKAYLQVNPRLRNPFPYFTEMEIDYKTATFVLSAISVFNILLLAVLRIIK